MASADELKALGNKAIAEKNFDEAVYVLRTLTLNILCKKANPLAAPSSPRPSLCNPRTTFFTATDQRLTLP